MSLNQNCFSELRNDQQQYQIYKALNSLSSFSIPEYDEIAIEYYGSTNNIETVTYLHGGDPVYVLTFTYAVQPPVENDERLVNIS
jgi:hypothetical protein